MDADEEKLILYERAEVCAFTSPFESKTRLFVIIVMNSLMWLINAYATDLTLELQVAK